MWRRIHWLCVILALAVAIGLLGADYHWLSDIMTGAIVGVPTGIVAAPTQLNAWVSADRNKARYMRS